MHYLKYIFENMREFAGNLPQDLRRTFAGAFASLIAFLASFPLELINRALQTVSLLIGIALAAVTLYRAFRHPDLAAILAQQVTILRRLGEIDEHGCTRHRKTVEALSREKGDEV